MTRNAKKEQMDKTAGKIKGYTSMNCETCAYFTYDEDYEDYYCAADMDEDDYVRLMQGTQRQCPFWKNGDEYAVVRHQM